MPPHATKKPRPSCQRSGNASLFCASVGSPAAASFYDSCSQAPSGVFSGPCQPARTVHAAGLVPAYRVRAVLFLSIFSSPPHALTPRGGVRRRGKNAASTPGRAARRLAGKSSTRSRPACSFGPGTAPGRPSIRVEPATVPSTFYRVRPKRPARLNKSPPLERTVPSQDHPAAQRRLSPTWLLPP
jgi:hypothetical protein